MHSATRRLISRFFIGVPHFLWAGSGAPAKMDALTSLNTRRAKFLSTLFKKLKKRKNRRQSDSGGYPLTNRLKLTILQIEKVLTSNVWSASRF